MQHWTWQVDKNTTITLTNSMSGTEKVSVNGEQVLESKNWFKFRSTHEFALKDGRNVKILIKLVLFVPEVRLEVDGQLVHLTRDVPNITCSSCSAVQQSYDKFCGQCGAELPKPEIVDNNLKVKKATQSILVLAVLFFLSGIVMHFLQTDVYEKSFKSLAAFADADEYPQLVNGVKYKVGELRTKLTIERYSLLFGNVFLALIMVGLSFWSKKSPLGAMLVASAIYLAIQVLNALLDPATIAQGLWMKIFTITILFSGIKAALELKPQKANANL